MNNDNKTETTKLSDEVLRDLIFEITEHLSQLEFTEYCIVTGELCSILLLYILKHSDITQEKEMERIIDEYLKSLEIQIRSSVSKNFKLDKSNEKH